jgi:hypothetical protein
VVKQPLEDAERPEDADPWEFSGWEDAPSVVGCRNGGITAVFACAQQAQITVQRAQQCSNYCHTSKPMIQNNPCLLLKLCNFLAV